LKTINNQIQNITPNLAVVEALPSIAKTTALQLAKNMACGANTALLTTQLACLLIKMCIDKECKVNYGMLPFTQLLPAKQMSTSEYEQL
jgi:hypothetical protein